MDGGKMKNSGSGMAIASMVCGIIGLILSCLIAGIVPCIIGLILGVLVIAHNRAGKGMAIAGVATSTIGIAIFLVVIIGVTGAKSKTSESGEIERIESSNTIQTSKSVQETTTETSTTFHPGDVLETKYDRLTYLSCDTDYVPDNKYFQPESGKKIVRLEFEYENTGKSDQSISFISFTGYADGYKVDPWFYSDDDLSGTISAGKKLKGALYFEVPDDAQEITVEYDVNYWTSEKTVFVVE